MWQNVAPKTRSESASQKNLLGHRTCESRGSSVSIVSGYGPVDRGSIPGRGTGYWGPFAGGKERPGREADHSPPSSAEVVTD
jgi:hypothetical protein